jgi:tetratricopeptide (TPR) repeat protein
MTRMSATRILVLLALLQFPSGLSLRAAEPWDVPFAGNPQVLLDAAKRIPVPETQPVLILLEQHQIAIDEGGRITSKVRKVFRVANEDALEEWASVEQEFQPWHESKPELRARVIAADGTVHWLEPKTIADSPAEEYDQTIFSDRRVIRAPLPAVAVGAVVEYEITVRESAPLLDIGEARRIIVYDAVPIQRFRLSLSTAKNIPLQVVSKLIPDSAIRRGETVAREEWECDWGPLEVRKNVEGNLPFDVPNYPYIAFSTAKSWQQVAASYEAIVDQQIRTGDLKSLLQGVDRTQPALVVSAQIAARLHKAVRYTGLEFGESEIVPHTPEETLKRNYGDCKDKAALLVAALRSVGLKSYVALLSAGFDTDVDPNLPGLGVFSHAIVYVAADPPIWIDATSAETRVGGIPPADQGRLALIANRETSALLKTPESPAEYNRSVHTIEMHMSGFGAGQINEVLEARGSSEARFRQLYAGSDDKKIKEELELYVKRDFLAKSVGEYAVTSRSDFSEPFKLQLTAKQAKRAFTAQDDAVAIVFPSLVVRDLPYPFFPGLFGTEPEDKTQDRKSDFVFPEPHTTEYRYKIYPPSGFKPKELARSIDLKLGTTEYKRQFRTNADGTVDAIFFFNSGKRRITSAEFQELREGLRPYTSPSAGTEMIRFVSEASEDVALGETGKALKLVTSSAVSHPEDLGAQVRLSRTMVSAGAVEGALAVAQQVVQKDRSFSAGWQALAWAYQFDSFGRRFHGNWDFGESEKSLREALKLEPDDIIAKVDLAILLETDADGVRYSSRAKLDEAIKLYRDVEKINPAAGITQNLVLDLIFAGHYAEAREELKKMQGEAIQPAFSTVLTAITENSARAIIDSQSNSPDERMRFVTLLQASGLLVELRHYSQAYDLLKAASRLQSSNDVQARMDMLLKMRRYDSNLYPEEDPRYPVAQAILETYSANPNLEHLKPFFTKRDDWTSLEEGVSRDWRNSIAARNRLISAGLSQENILDIAVSILEIKNPGGADLGYRISGISSLGPLPVMYVVQEDGKYKILGTSDSPDQVGERVFQLLGHQDIKSAQAWLDLVVPDVQGPSFAVQGAPSGFTVTVMPAARYLWSGVVESTRGPTAITTSAAALIGPFNGSPKAIELLTEARGHAASLLERGQIDLALCQSFEKSKQWGELLVCARRLETNRVFEREGFRFLAKALSAQNDWKGLQAEAERKLKSSSKNSDALLDMATSLIHLGERERASQYLKSITDSPYSGPDELLLEAWNSLLNGKPDSEVLSKFDKWSNLPEMTSANYWYTVGNLQASLNMPDDAQRSLLKALDADDRGASDPKPWVLASKIYEQYGLKDAAATARQKAASLSPSDDMAKWALLLLSSQRKTESAPLH